MHSVVTRAVAGQVLASPQRVFPTGGQDLSRLQPLLQSTLSRLKALLRRGELQRLLAST